MKGHCIDCGFFLPAATCRDEIRGELEACNLKGVCGEATQMAIRLHYIAFPDTSGCGKFQKDGVA